MNINSKKILLLLIVLLVVEQIFAQVPPPPPGNELPINGAVYYLLVAGILYGIKKLKK